MVPASRARPSCLSDSHMPRTCEVATFGPDLSGNRSSRYGGSDSWRAVGLSHAKSAGLALQRSRSGAKPDGRWGRQVSPDSALQSPDLGESATAAALPDRAKVCCPKPIGPIGPGLYILAPLPHSVLVAPLFLQILELRGQFRKVVCTTASVPFCPIPSADLMSVHIQDRHSNMARVMMSDGVKP